MKTKVAVRLFFFLLTPACFADHSGEKTGTLGEELSIQYVQGHAFSEESGTGQTSASVTLTQAQTRGDLNIVSVGWNNATSPSIATVTDSAGNVYSFATGASVAYSDGPATMAMFYAPNIASASITTVTVQFSSPVLYPEVIAAEYSGADPIAPYDTGVGQGGDTATSDSGALTTSVPNELLVSTDYVLHSTENAGPGFSERFRTDDADILQDMIATSVGSYSATAPLNKGWWAALLGAFRPARSPTPAKTGRAVDGNPDAAVAVDPGDAGDAPAIPTEGGQGTADDAATDDAASDDGASEAAASDDGASEAAASDDATSDAAAEAAPGLVDAPVASWDGGVAFPLKTIPGKRYLADQNNVPYLVRGDSAWALITTLPYAELASYVADRQAKGFNSISVELIDNYFTAGSNGANANGDLPFLLATDGSAYTDARAQLADFSTPNPPYWASADLVLDYLASRGVLVFLYPTWLGFGGGGQNVEGYYPSMEANSLTALQAYGQFVGQRYGALPNIVWMLGGDYNPPDKTTTEAIANGIAQVDTTHLMSVDCADGTSPLDYWDGEPWLTLNNIYTDSQLGHPFVYQKSFAEYQLSDALPFFLKESCYENANSSTPTLIRQQAYEAILSGGSGQFYGSIPLWQLQPGYESYLNTRAALDMEQWNSLFASRRWDLLVPDIGGAFVLNDDGYTGTLPSAAAQFVSGARASDGSWGVVYFPGTEQATLDLSGFAHNVDAYWFDPTSGGIQLLPGGPLANAGSVELTPPGSNSTGDLDWVLVLE